MDRRNYALMEDYMLSCMQDSAHDKEHVYRVLYNAMIIAEKERDVNYDVLIGACLLHDIGRQEQFADPAVCHAEAGAEKEISIMQPVPCRHPNTPSRDNRQKSWNYYWN